MSLKGELGANESQMRFSREESVRQIPITALESFEHVRKGGHANQEMAHDHRTREVCSYTGVSSDVFMELTCAP